MVKEHVPISPENSYHHFPPELKEVRKNRDLDVRSTRQAFQEGRQKKNYHAFGGARIIVQDVHDMLCTVWRWKNDLFIGQHIPSGHALFIQSANNNKLQLLSTSYNR